MVTIPFYEVIIATLNVGVSDIEKTILEELMYQIIKLKIIEVITTRKYL